MVFMWLSHGGRETRLHCSDTYFSVGSSDNGFMENKFALTECVVRRWRFSVL
jgi:hypothetical protein